MHHYSPTLATLPLELQARRSSATCSNNSLLSTTRVSIFRGQQPTGLLLQAHRLRFRCCSLIADERTSDQEFRCNRFYQSRISHLHLPSPCTLLSTLSALSPDQPHWRCLQASPDTGRKTQAESAISHHNHHHRHSLLLSPKCLHAACPLESHWTAIVFPPHARPTLTALSHHLQFTTITFPILMKLAPETQHYNPVSGSDMNAQSGHGMPVAPPDSGKGSIAIARTAGSASYERPERARTSHACEPCRERKTKCDGERPSCRRCLHTGNPCHYGFGKGWRKRK